MTDDVHGHEQRGEAIDDERVTAPMQPYTTGQVTTGAAVLAVGLALTFGLPLLLA